MKTIYLEKVGVTGPCFWKAEIEGNKVTYSFGKVDGAVQQKTVTYTEGKNVGRANETTPEEQCLLEAEIKARKKCDKEYKLISGEITSAATVTKTNFDVPLPMLAKSYPTQVKSITGMVYFQAKLDGNRCIVNRFTGEMFSRTRKPITHLGFIGKAVIEAAKALPPEITWVDGELIGKKGMTFNDTQTAIRREKNVDDKLASQMVYHIFDVVSPLPWSKRRDIVAAVKENEIVHTVPDIYADASKLNEYHNKYVTEGGYEGAIIRLDGDGYKTGPTRSSYLIKYKTFVDSEFKIIGWKAEKHDPNLLGVAVLEMEDGKTFEARPAMTDKEKADLWKNKDKYIGKMATIKYQELDAKSGIPRLPVYKGIRAEGDLEGKKSATKIKKA